MDPRKMRILRAVTDDYIRTAEPVGSRTIARKYDLGVSPATIRNEMADLEELGYLEQPHTSAGRVPSDKGYRFYVDVLMDPEELSVEEQARLREEVAGKRWAAEALIQQASRTLSWMTHYTAVVLLPRLSQAVVKRVQLTPIDPFHALAVVVTEPGFVQNEVVEFPREVDDPFLSALAERLSERLAGKSFRDLTRGLLSELREELEPVDVYDEMVEFLVRSLEDKDEERVYLEGTLHLFEQPEFRDIERARMLLSFLEQDSTLASLLSEATRRSGTQVTIGREHRPAEMQGCSMVTATYSAGGQVIGAVGVIGPTRMDYARAVAAVELLAESLSEVFSSSTRRVSW